MEYTSDTVGYTTQAITGKQAAAFSHHTYLDRLSGSNLGMDIIYLPAGRLHRVCIKHSKA